MGFLPLLALIPHAILARRGWPAPAHGLRGLPLAGAATLLVAIGVWFVPMMIASSAGGDLLDYRNEILFKQTVTRYADAWHHHEPVWYYFTNVIPVLWLPLIALVPWLWPRWRTALRERDTLVAVLLAWVVIVLLFFSFSSGKRGVYVLPAVPALAMAAAPWLPELLRARGPRRLAFVLAMRCSTALTAAAAVYFAVDARAAARIVDQDLLQPVLPLAIVAIAGAAAIWLLRERDGWLAYAATLAVLLATIGFVVYPRIDADRSGRAFMARVEEASAGHRRTRPGRRQGAVPAAAASSEHELRSRALAGGRCGGGGRGGLARRASRPGAARESHGTRGLFQGRDRGGHRPGESQALVPGDRCARIPAASSAATGRRARLYVPPNASLNTDG